MKSVFLLLFVAMTINTYSQGEGYPNFKDNPSLQVEGKVAKYEEITQSNLELLFDERLKPFYHGVASGDPSTNSVIIWTRIQPETEGTKELSWRIATDPELSNVIKTGNTSTNMEKDYTVKVEVTGLEPNSVYYYGFTYEGVHSLTGRTRTLPTGSVDRARFGVVTGTNYAWGYFNGYKKLSERNDLSAILHTGDYFYEYAKGTYFLPYLEGRDVYPENKCVTVDDYRGRFSQYRLDPDLRALHQQHPMIAIWDDHETANDCWVGGAEAHDAEDGDWNARKNSAIQVYHEWMPVQFRSEEDKFKMNRSFTYGDLLDLVVVEARLSGRDKQLAPKGDGGEVNVMEWLNPERTLLGNEQFNWLVNEIATSQSKWKVMLSSIMMYQLYGFGPVVDAFGQAMGNQDSWDGYPVERARLFGFLLQNNIQNFGVLSGDFHTAWAGYLAPNPLNLEINPVNPTEANPWPTFDGATGAGAVGFEFTTPSVTTANLNEQESFSGIPVFGLPERSPQAQQIEALVKGGNPHYKYANTDQHGYMIVDFSKDKAQADFYYTVNNEQTVDSLKPFPNLMRVNTEMFSEGWYVMADTKTLVKAEDKMPDLENAPEPAPKDPPKSTSVNNDNTMTGVFLEGIYPNPVSTNATFSYIVSKPQHIKIKIYDVNGNQIALIANNIHNNGIYRVDYNAGNLSSGTYYYTLETADGKMTRIMQVVK